MITEAQKKRIMEAIAANRGNYPSDAKHAASLGITTSVYSAVKNGQTDKVLSDANWIGIARRLGVNLRGEMEAVIGIHHEMKKVNETDWEKRRYEIAKEIFLRMVRTSLNSVEDDAENAVKWADLFISKLKKER